MTRTSRFRNLTPQTLALGALFILAAWLVLRILLVPDPAGGLLWARARRLEDAGLITQSLHQYKLLADTHADSEYAPLALQRSADLIVDRARSNPGDTNRTSDFGLAIAAYRRLADSYPASNLAGPAALAVGAIYENDLRDLLSARQNYTRVLQTYPGNAELGGEATLRLGRVALAARDGQNAQMWLQKVLQKYAGFRERCAEAQFHLGETYETIFKNRETARNAYEATLKNYPKSVWAASAKERIGLLLYGEGAPRARRVLLAVPSGAIEGDASSLQAALQSVFAARGLNVDETIFRGWSGEAFWAGIMPGDLSRAPSVPFIGWENAVASAGLRYSILDGGDAAVALKNLQSELDDAHLALVYGGAWRLATGYDSQDNLVFLQRGARQDKITTAALGKLWNRTSSLGGAFSLLTFSAPGEDENLKPQILPNAPAFGAAPAPKSKKEVAAIVSPLATPTYLYKLKPLNENAAHRRALRQAAQWLKRGRSNAGEREILLGSEALRYLANAMTDLSSAPQIDSPAIYPEDSDPPVRVDSSDAGDANPDDTDADNALATPAPTALSQAKPTAAPRAPSPTDAIKRARALLPWRGAPLSAWLASRRAAAAYCDVAAARLKEPSLRDAANAFHESVAALQSAASALPPRDNLAEGGTLSPAARAAFAAAARHIERARIAEDRAANIIAAAAS